MNNLRLPFAAAALLAVLSSSARATAADDAFNAAINTINDSTAKIVAAQAKRSQAPKADAKAPSCTPAQIDAAYAALPRCADSISKAYNADIRDYRGAVKKGFSPDLGLVLLTATDAYFYHEDCDICAAVERCSLKDGSISNFKTAHSVGCDDLAPLLKKDVAYSACPLRP